MREVIDQRPPAPNDLVYFGTVCVVDGSLSEELCFEVVFLGGHRVVAQRSVLDDDVAHVDAEARHSPSAPEPHDVVEREAHLLVPPVEVRLLGEVIVQVGLAGSWVVGPCRAAKTAHPVVRRRAVGLRVRPHVPLAFGRVARRTCIEEPGVLVAGVIGHQIHEDPDPSSSGFCDEAIDVLHGAEVWLDGAEVRHVVAPVTIGGPCDG